MREASRSRSAGRGSACPGDRRELNLIVRLLPHVAQGRIRLVGRAGAGAGRVRARHSLEGVGSVRSQIDGLPVPVCLSVACAARVSCIYCLVYLNNSPATHHIPLTMALAAHEPVIGM